MNYQRLAQIVMKLLETALAGMAAYGFHSANTPDVGVLTGTGAAMVGLPLGGLAVVDAIRRLHSFHPAATLPLSYGTSNAKTAGPATDSQADELLKIAAKYAMSGQWDKLEAVKVAHQSIKGATK